MDSAKTGTAKRIARVLIAGGLLAGGWFLADTVSTTEPASAASTIDILPVGGPTNPVTTLVSTVTTTVTQVVTPVTTTVVAPVVTTVVTPVITPVVTTVVTPVVTNVVTPVVTPIVTPVTAAVAEVVPPVVGVVTPVLQGVSGVTTPVLAPITSVVVDGVVVPIVGPVTSVVIDGVVTPVVQVVIDGVLTPVVVALDPAVVAVGTALAPVIGSIPPPISDLVFSAASGVIATTPAVATLAQIANLPSYLPLSGPFGLSAALIGGLAAAATMFTPAGHRPASPTGAPHAPVTPAASTSSIFGSSEYGEFTSGFPIGRGSSDSTGAAEIGLPSSPTFASDTTPD